MDSERCLLRMTLFFFERWKLVGLLAFFGPQHVAVADFAAQELDQRMVRGMAPLSERLAVLERRPSHLLQLPLPDVLHAKKHQCLYESVI